MTDFNSLQYFFTGLLFGLTAGISPGPLLTLVITETLNHNKKEGFKVAIAPIITDTPVIFILFMLFSQITKINLFLSLISFAGAIFIFILGFETFRLKNINLTIQNQKPRSLHKGILANFFSPHPYLFWLTIGIPVAFQAWKSSWVNAVLFFLAFYIFLIGSKIGIALLIEHSKAFISSRIYFWIMKILGLVLFLFSSFFIYEGIKFIIQ